MADLKKLTEYEAFKKAITTLETEPDVIFVEVGEYVISTKTKLSEQSARLHYKNIMKQHIFNERIN